MSEIEKLTASLWRVTQGRLMFGPKTSENDVPWDEWKAYAARYPHALGQTVTNYEDLAAKLHAELSQSERVSRLEEALTEARDVLEGMNDDEINLELLPRLNAALSFAADLTASAAPS